MLTAGSGSSEVESPPPEEQPVRDVRLDEPSKVILYTYTVFAMFSDWLCVCGTDFLGCSRSNESGRRILARGGAGREGCKKILPRCILLC